MEYPCYCWVDRDKQVLFLFDFLVPLVDSFRHPSFENWPNQLVAHIDYPLLWNLFDLLFDRKMPHYIEIGAPLLQDVIHAEALVLWTCFVLNVVCTYELFSAADQVLQEV